MPRQDRSNPFQRKIMKTLHKAPQGYRSILLWLGLCLSLLLGGMGQGLAQTGTVVRTIKSQPGTPQRYQVSVTITPEAAVNVYAAEERVPNGWTVTEVLDLGSSSGGVIRWGPFFDSQVRTLRYSLQATAGASASVVSGAVSFDGDDVVPSGDVALATGGGGAPVIVEQPSDVTASPGDSR